MKLSTVARPLLPLLLGALSGLAAAQPLPGHAFPTQPSQPSGGSMPGAMPGMGAAPSLDQLMAWERQDMGVPPVAELHDGPFHGPTPNKLPGGQVITTKGLLPLLKSGMPVQVFDVLGAGQALPNAQPLAWAAQPGGFDDATQQQLQQVLQQATQGRNDVPLVFYCGGPQCWMSYNAALRAIKQIVKRTEDLPRREARATRLPALIEVLTSEDVTEGTNAFKERRPPRWSGR